MAKKNPYSYGCCSRCKSIAALVESAYGDNVCLICAAELKKQYQAEQDEIKAAKRAKWIATRVCTTCLWWKNMFSGWGSECCTNSNWSPYNKDPQNPICGRTFWRERPDTESVHSEDLGTPVEQSTPCIGASV